LALFEPNVGGAAEVDAAGRNAVGAEGLDTLRLSFSLSLGGDGESSIMSTHPDESAEGFFLFLSSASVERLCESTLHLCAAVKLAGRSTPLVLVTADLLEDEDDEEPTPFATVDMARAFAFGRPVILPIRNRGTRV
jgi:hypothetical protein